MITFIAFILTILGCIDWLLVGLLQYDFIAGLFGFQASIFSRIIYILFGVASVYLVLRVIINKGTFKVYEKRKKKEKQQNSAPAYANIEAGKEQISHKEEKQEDISDMEEYINQYREFDNENYDSSHDNLFDEHFRDR